MTSGKKSKPQGTVYGLGIEMTLGSREEHLHILNIGGCRQTGTNTPWPLNRPPRENTILHHEGNNSLVQGPAMKQINKGDERGGGWFMNMHP